MNNPRIDDGMWQYLMESQAKSQREELPLELLPALRARYGNFLRECIASVTVGGLGADAYCVTVLEMGASTRRISLDHWLRPASSMNDLMELEKLVPPLSTARHLMLRMSENRDLLQELALFTPYAQEALEELATRACEINDFDNQMEAATAVSSAYKDAATTLACHIAPATRDAVEKAVLKKYKSTEAFGVGAEDAKNEWQELGSILCANGHVLRETGLDELRRRVDVALKRLSPVEQTALWFEYGSAEDFIDRHPTAPDGRTYGPNDDTNSRNQIGEHIVKRLTHAVFNDWDNRPQL